MRVRDHHRKTAINNQVMLKVVINNDIWHAWNRLLPQAARGSAIGSTNHISGLGTSPIDITLVKDCGMQIIHIEIRDDPSRLDIKNGFVLNHKLTLTVGV